MGDSIYTLLIIAWVAYGIYSAVKKNKAKAAGVSATQQTEKPKTKDAIESVFESLFQENSQNYSEINSPYYESASVDAGAKPDSYEDEYDEYEESDYLDTVPEATVESELDTYSGTDNMESSIILEEEMDEIQKSAIDSNADGELVNSFEFDLRTAVIAQTVLERPYE